MKFNGRNLLSLQGEIIAKEICIAAFIKEKCDELTTKISVSFGSVSFQKLNMPIARKWFFDILNCSAFDIQFRKRLLFFTLKTFLSLKTNFSKRHIHLAVIMNSGVTIFSNSCLISCCKHNPVRWFQLILAGFCPVSCQNVVPICRNG